MFILYTNDFKMENQLNQINVMTIDQLTYPSPYQRNPTGRLLDINQHKQGGWWNEVTCFPHQPKFEIIIWEQA